MSTLTTHVYGAFREARYDDAIKALNVQRQSFPRSRAALSLLGYAYYHVSDYRNAAAVYEELSAVCPEVDEYKLYYAQCLYKCGFYAEASRASLRIDSKELRLQVLALRRAIKYEEDDLSTCKSLLDQCMQDDPDTLVHYAAICVKEQRFEEARAKYAEATQILGFTPPEIQINLSLCDFKEQKFASALKGLGLVIEKAVREHPELSVGSATDGIEVRSVGNSLLLQETFLVEAFNLKCAIEYEMGNFEAAREALSDMPPRNEHELDAITLHNAALLNVDTKPSNAFTKLNYLLSNPPFPPEAYGNLLLLHCKFGFTDVAADFIAENGQLTFKFLSGELYDFLDATIITKSSPQEAFKKFDDLAAKHVENLRKLTKKIQDARISRDNEAIKLALKNYDAALEQYMPVLMAQAKIYWDHSHYEAVEKLFRQSAEFCSDHAAWKLNVAHTFFVQEKFSEAIKYYEPIVKKTNDLLKIPAVVLANLCVAFIMTSANEAAEDLMRDIEKQEENTLQQHFHLCIVNLVIGTL